MHFLQKMILIAVMCIAGPAWAGSSLLTLNKHMAAHKALYDIEMVSKGSGSQVVNVSGQMFYEWRPGCDAWTTDHRFNLFYEYADSPPIRISSDFSTYETYDGKSFNFTSRRKRNGELYQEIRGVAEKNDDGSGAAMYSLPNGLEFKLDKNMLFPMGHSLGVLNAALKGESFYSTIVFDGSDDGGPVEINTFIGKQANAFEYVKVSDKIDKNLLESKAWKIRMAFFPLQEALSDSEYEMDAIFHENGVISDMLVEYRDFSVTQKLRALQSVDAENCDKVEKY